MQQVGKAHHHNWVRRVEHVVLRVVSFVFSVVSAHAILWFFSSLDWIDVLQPWVKWGIAGGFCVLGYFVSRGLAHRLLNRERVLAYLFICGVFELVEVVCNYSEGSSSFDGITWLSRIHGLQQGILAVLIQIVLSIIPVVTVMLAWVDMDLERAKQGYEVRGFGGGFQGGMGKGTPVVPRPGLPPQPKGALSAMPSAVLPSLPVVPQYQQGYTGVSAAPSPAAATAQEPDGWFSGVRERLPFGRREQVPPVPQPTPQTMAPPSTSHGVQGNGIAPMSQ